MTNFVPNPKAVATEVAKLTGKQPGGGKATIDDACLVASDRMYDEPSENSRIFWRAVYDALDAMRKGKQS